MYIFIFIYIYVHYIYYIYYRDFGDSIWRPLELIFGVCLNQLVFPEIWENANIVSVHKKDKETIQNCIAASLLQSFGKVLEGLFCIFACFLPLLKTT